MARRVWRGKERVCREHRLAQRMARIIAWTTAWRLQRLEERNTDCAFGVESVRDEMGEVVGEFRNGPPSVRRDLMHCSQQSVPTASGSDKT